MNILILNWRDPKHPLSGGAEISLFHNAQYWSKKGSVITWFASSYAKSVPEENMDGIRVIRRGNHYTVFFWFFLHWIQGKYHDADIIIDSFHFVPFLTALYIRDRIVIGLINEVAGDVWFDNIIFPLAFIGYKVEPFLIRLYKNKHFITGSQSASEDLQEAGISKDKISIINHGFTPLVAKGKISKEKDPTILFLGRLSKDKGIEDALLMLELLIRDDKRIKLWVVGKFENRNYEQRLKKLINVFRVKKNCVFYGYVDEKTKAELLRKVWILVHPSTKEGWGLNVIEANSVGTPSVGYNVQGLRDSIQDGKTGILVEPNAINLADGVQLLIEDKKKLKELSSAAKKWATTFSWEKSGRESYEVINRIYQKRS